MLYETISVAGGLPSRNPVTLTFSCAGKTKIPPIPQISRIEIIMNPIGGISLEKIVTFEPFPKKNVNI